MELLLLSNSSSVRGYLVDALFEITPFARGLRDAAFVPYAAVTRSYDAYEARVAEALEPAGLNVRSVHHADDPAAAVRKASLIIVGGGNTFHLLHECRRTGVLAAIGERVRAGAARYLAWSAGSNLACPTIRTTNDMPVVDPGGFDALGFVPFQINPHFTDAIPNGHFGETRSERLAEFVALNPTVPVLALPEGSWVRQSEATLTLGGERGAQWIVPGRDAEVLAAGPLVVPALAKTAQ